jgi:hypothetical protein
MWSGRELLVLVALRPADPKGPPFTRLRGPAGWGQVGRSEGVRMGSL